MERYHPRAGLWCLVVALPTWVVFLFNGMLGFFPAVIFAEGGVGQKFHFWLFIQDNLDCLEVHLIRFGPKRAP